MMQQRLEPQAVQVATLAVQRLRRTLYCKGVRLPYEGGAVSALVTMPVGNWSAQMAEGERALDYFGWPMPYSYALKACREAVSASLAGISLAGDDVRWPGDAPSSMWAPADHSINLYLPRFEIEFSSGLKKILQRMRVEAPFEGGHLTKMATGPGGAAVGNLSVSELLHKVHEKVDELGTEATAVTGVLAIAAGPPGKGKPPVDIRFDRPFLFDIVHDTTGVQLYTGVVYKPEEWEEA